MNPGNVRPESSQSLKKIDSWMRLLEVNYLMTNVVPEKRGSVTFKDVDFEGLKRLFKGFEKHKFVALGNFSSSVLRKLNINHFKMPHPSPRNRLLNSREFEYTMLEKCKEYLDA
jgi:hypothetical protein